MSVISYSKFRAQLVRWGVRFVEHSRYDRCTKTVVPWYQHQARRYRDCEVRPWDAHGIAIHHTGGPTAWTYVWDGRLEEKIPGPLYTAEIYEDGVAHLTGWLVTNNVGSCDKTVRDRAVAGNMPTSGGNVTPGADDYYAGNSEFYGIAYRGTAPNALQRNTAMRMCAAICEAHGSDWDGGSVAGHKELTARKPDPKDENMSTFRAGVNILLKAGPESDMPNLDSTDLVNVEKALLKALNTRVPWASPGVAEFAEGRGWSTISARAALEYIFHRLVLVQDSLTPTQDLIRQAIAEAADDPDVPVSLDAAQIDALGASAARHLLAKIAETPTPQE